MRKMIQDWRSVDKRGIIPPEWVSSASRWEDDQWTFDHPNRDTQPCNRRIVWKISLTDGSLLTDVRHRKLLEAVKLFTWSMHVLPPNGRLPLKGTSLMKCGDYALMLVKWMVAQRTRRFCDLTREDIEKYMAYVRSRKSTRRKGLIDRYTSGCIARVVEDIYLQRRLLPDAIQQPPFRPGERPSDLMRGRMVVPTDRIPDSFARELFLAAESWILSAEPIITLYTRFHRNLQAVRGSGKFSHLHNAKSRRELERRAAFSRGLTLPLAANLPLNCPRLDSAIGLARAANYLTVACYIIVALLTGMRVSEILSLQARAVRKIRHKVSGKQYGYISSIEHKIRGRTAGVRMRWVAPPIVCHAVNVLTKLTRSHRMETGFAELFLTRGYLAGRATAIEKRELEKLLNRFADAMGIAQAAGQTWRLKTHQFRRSFARFVAIRDHTGLVALSTHLKHVSLVMTDQGYVGTDFSIDELIDKELESLVMEAVQSITSGEPLGGPMAARISQQLEFMGRAGTQQRKDYERFILEDTSLILIPDVFGTCVFSQETALCQGSDSLRGLSTCMNCSNMLITQEHRPFWVEYVRRCKEMIRLARSPLQVAPIRNRLKRAGEFLRQLDGQSR